MRLKLFFLISSVSCFQLSSQVDFDFKKSFKQDLAKISDSCLMSKYEVSNKLYNMFLQDLKQKNMDLYLSARIDSSHWNDKFVGRTALVKYYHTHPAYEEYPVVNISYEGALLFCNWLEEKYKLAKVKSKIKKIRLSYKTEWENAAKGLDTKAIYSWMDTTLLNRNYRPNGQFLGSFEAMTEPGNLNDGWTETAPVFSFYSNSLGLYNMCGNVAEMVMEKGSTKGGSWGSKAEYLKIEGADEFLGYKEPSPFIGFRFVVVLEKKLR